VIRQLYALGNAKCTISAYAQQKLLEEAPFARAFAGRFGRGGGGGGGRLQMGSAAVDACKRILFQRGKPSEFLLDEDNRLYFMDLKYWIQVEIRMTEMVTLADMFEIKSYQQRVKTWS